METEITSGKIIKIAVGVAFLIVIIVFVSLIKPNKKADNLEIQSIILNRKSITLTVGKGYSLKAIVSPSNVKDNTIKYMSNNVYVASVDGYGNVKANNPGEAKITALTSNGKQDECTVTVIEEVIPITSITLDHDDITLVEGESLTLKVNVTPLNTTEHEFIWTSSDESVATVLDGKVTGLKSGTTLITVMSESKKMAICDVEVRENVTGIKLDINEKTISVGDTLNINATLEPIGTSETITWISSDETIAAVENGRVTAKKVGTVTITAKSGNVSAKANIKVKIVSTSDIYTFKYDNNKPLMSCKSYTANDRIELDAKLKAAIERVGYGTRAGVVEAARFFVGALDYKVRYLGPKKESYEVGRYPYVGLNIGKSGAWGCKVAGYTQGIDCTNFVSWAFINGGIGNKSTMSTKNTYKSAEVVDKIKPGDLMYNPCSGERCKVQAYNHVGIVIGVDENKIYVAEAKSESKYGGVVVTEWNKNNMPKSGAFSIVRLFPYESDGKLTDMWD